ncbi:MAG: hypothetical protein ACFHU9_08510 [Fluviicola sp.]
MKRSFKSLEAILFLTLSLILIVGCTEAQEEESSKPKEKIEVSQPKSYKGNWTEEDAKRFMKDVSSSVPENIQAMGDEAVEKILACYLNKAVLNYESYDHANENRVECAKLAYGCINELVRSEEIPEEKISDEKLKEVTNNLDELLKDQLPEK